MIRKKLFFKKNQFLFKFIIKKNKYPELRDIKFKSFQNFFLLNKRKSSVKLCYIFFLLLATKSFSIEGNLFIKNKLCFNF